MNNNNCYYFYNYNHDNPFQKVFGISPFRVFGHLSSSLLLYFNVSADKSSGVFLIRESPRNFEPSPLFNPRFDHQALSQEFRQLIFGNYELVLLSVIFSLNYSSSQTCSELVKLAAIVKGEPNALLLIANISWCTGERYSILWFAALYLIMLNVKQGSFKYHFLSLWYDSTCD